MEGHDQPADPSGPGPGDEDERAALAALAAVADRMPGFSLDILRDHAACILLLTPSGRISFLNRAGYTLLEIAEAGELAWRDWWDLWPEDSVEMIRHAISRAAAREPVSFEAVCPTRTGRALWWEVKLTPLVNAEGEAESLLAVMTDLTARHGPPAGVDPAD